MKKMFDDATALMSAGDFAGSINAFKEIIKEICKNKQIATFEAGTVSLASKSIVDITEPRFRKKRRRS